MVWEDSSPSRCEGWSEEVGPWDWLIHLLRSGCEGVKLAIEGVKWTIEGLNFGIEGINFQKSWFWMLVLFWLLSVCKERISWLRVWPFGN
jgi:hypothetical protein